MTSELLRRHVVRRLWDGGSCFGATHHGTAAERSFQWLLLDGAACLQCSMNGWWAAVEGYHPQVDVNNRFASIKRD